MGEQDGNMWGSARFIHGSFNNQVVTESAQVGRHPILKYGIATGESEMINEEHTTKACTLTKFAPLEQTCPRPSLVGHAFLTQVRYVVLIRVHLHVCVSSLW